MAANDVFTYGSLVFPEVMRAVTRRSFAHEPARIADWVRVCFRDASYPGLRERAGGSTPGILWRGVDPESLERLDRYETKAYERRALTVRTGDGKNVRAQVYVVGAAYLRLLSSEPWDRSKFARESLRDFVRMLNRSGR